jgi:hypothetical protein
VGHRGDHADGYQYEGHGQQRDLSQVRPEVPPRSEDRRDVQQRGQEQQEHHVRLELDPWETRHEAKHQPTEDQQDRVGDPDPVGEGRERGHRREQYEDRFYLRQGARILSLES